MGRGKSRAGKSRKDITKLVLKCSAVVFFQFANMMAYSCAATGILSTTAFTHSQGPWVRWAAAPACPPGIGQEIVKLFLTGTGCFVFHFRTCLSSFLRALPRAQEQVRKRKVAVCCPEHLLQANEENCS